MELTVARVSPMGDDENPLGHGEGAGRGVGGGGGQDRKCESLGLLEHAWNVLGAGNASGAAGEPGDRE